MPPPRPILKRDRSSSIFANLNPFPFAACATLFSPRVHFPPTPGLVSTAHTADSGQIYDRAPIVVSPNCCALPARGEREYFESADEEGRESEERGRSRRRMSVKGSYFHPRAYEACETEPEVSSSNDTDSDESHDNDRARVPSDSHADAAVSSRMLPPPLVRDSSSSESDESDVTTPPDPNMKPVSSLMSVQFSFPNDSTSLSQPPLPVAAEKSNALSFLPHPPSSPSPIPTDKDKERRKRNSTLSAPARRPRRPTMKRTVSAFAEEPLEGCLAGF